MSKVCLLDPKAERKLEPQDGLEFDWFLFGARHLPLVIFAPLTDPLTRIRES